MSVALFEEISLYVGVGALILLMAYIVWDLARKSNAGKFGTFILFLVLGLGVLGFLIKAAVSEIMGI
jgi:lipopolysaccharide export LptBFGC system permease protein LptF